MVRMDFSYLTRTNGLYVLRSAADIVVVAYIIYRVMLLIRGTRAQQVLVGLGLIALSFFGSKLFDLKTLSWILDNFISSFVLIIIVVFQHDIRRGLSRVGKRPMFEALAYGQGAFLVDELTRGAESLAKDRIGAIIIIEREADLTELAETGIRVDARISTGLLVQMFIPPGPLHDGAVIIQQGRLSAGAVFLPLTQNPRLDPSLGTRHRAAVGVTEEVDAIAIVVSEERGMISVAEGGTLARDLDAATLRKVLQRYFGTRQLRKKDRAAKKAVGA
jgi:diadenylate cyclase